MRDANVYVICWMLIALWTVLYGHHKWKKGSREIEGNKSNNTKLKYWTGYDIGWVMGGNEIDLGKMITIYDWSIPLVVILQDKIPTTPSNTFNANGFDDFVLICSEIYTLEHIQKYYHNEIYEVSNYNAESTILLFILQRNTNFNLASLCITGNCAYYKVMKKKPHTVILTHITKEYHTPRYSSGSNEVYDYHILNPDTWKLIKLNKLTVGFIGKKDIQIRQIYDPESHNRILQYFSDNYFLNGEKFNIFFRVENKVKNRHSFTIENVLFQNISSVKFDFVTSSDRFPQKEIYVKYLVSVIYQQTPVPEIALQPSEEFAKRIFQYNDMSINTDDFQGFAMNIDYEINTKNKQFIKNIKISNEKDVKHSLLKILKTVPNHDSRNKFRGIQNLQPDFLELIVKLKINTSRNIEDFTNATQRIEFSIDFTDSDQEPYLNNITRNFYNINEIVFTYNSSMFTEGLGGLNVNYHSHTYTIYINQKVTKKPVTTEWKNGEWGECSNLCGKGTQERPVNCLSSDGIVVKNDLCSKEKPAESQSCTSYDFCQWQTGEWSGCVVDNGVCGFGKKTRNVSCQSGENCIGIKPDTKNSCEVDCKEPAEPPAEPPAVTYSWQIGDWTRCSKLCGGGTQTQTFFCQDSNGNLADDVLCPDKPDIEQRCNTKECDDCSITVNGDNLENCEIPTDATSVTDLPKRSITITGVDGCVIPSNINYHFVENTPPTFEKNKAYSVYCNSYKYTPEFGDTDKDIACKDVEFGLVLGKSHQFKSDCLMSQPQPITTEIGFDKPNWMDDFEVTIEKPTVNCEYPDNLPICPPPCATLQNTHYEFSQFSKTGGQNTNAIMTGAHYWSRDPLRRKLVDILGDKINDFEYIKDENTLMRTGNSCFKVDEWRSGANIDYGKLCLDIGNQITFKEPIDPNKVTSDNGESYINYFHPIYDAMFIDVDNITTSNANDIATKVNDYFKNMRSKDTGNNKLKYIYTDDQDKRVLVVYTKTDKNDCKPCESDTYYQSMQTLLMCKCPKLDEQDKNTMLAENCRCGAKFWVYDAQSNQEICKPY